MEQRMKLLAEAAQLRPTLVVGLGGSGYWTVLKLKRLIYRNWAPELIEARVRFVVFDTAQEELPEEQDGQAIRLEPGSEFFDIGNTPVASIKRNLTRQGAIEARLGGVIGRLPPVVLRSGAKQMRPLGLLALLWRFSEIEAVLQSALWSLANRHNSQGREGINVFIVNSLVGGTGSSAFLDVAYLIRELVDGMLGTMADFCYITGLGLLPRAFHGVEGPNLIPNAVASLKELNLCMMRGDFKARYPNGRTITTQQPPFNLYYLLDGVDERSRTWRSATEVCHLAAEAIFLQMGSQIGLRRENIFDNLDEVLAQQTEEGVGTFYGSVGLASLYFNGEAAAGQCAARYGLNLIDQGLLAEEFPTLEQAVAELVETAGLEPARLVERLAADDQGLPLTVELSVPGWASRLAPASVPAELVRYTRDYEQARLNTDYKRCLSQNEARLAQEAGARLAAHLGHLARQAGLPAAERFLKEVLSRLAAFAAHLSQQQQNDESQLLGLSQELGHLETVFLQAGESGFFGRRQRVLRAQQLYMSAAATLFKLRWQSQVAAAALAVLNQAGRAAQQGLVACQSAVARLDAVRRSLQTLQTSLRQPELAGVTSRALLDDTLLERLYEQHAPPVADTLAALFSREASPLDWCDLPPAEIQAMLLAVCEPAFAPIARLTIEEVIRRQETSPESLYAWLLAQAAPSWNLDRTRLAEGGAALKRLEVVGVPDELNSLYRQHARTLVSTGDPTRITAFVAHLGAAHTALQQFDSYQAAYEQARSSTPLHILPQFQTNQEWARQTFALGSLFGFIRNEGTHFYYIPADPLARRLKLAQGLGNSLQSFISREDLVQETRERVDRIVTSRGVEATLQALRRYYEAGPNGQDELVLELKRLVRAYADELRQINQFAPAFTWLPAPDGAAETEPDLKESQ